MKHIVFFVMLICLSCKKGTPNPQIMYSDNLTIIDSLIDGTDKSSFEYLHQIGYYPVYYIGERKDTIILGKSPVGRFARKDYSTLRNFTYPDSIKIKITVDTLIKTFHPINHSTVEGIDSIRYYKSYGVLISNNCDSLISLGIFSELGSTVRQIKSIRGEWIDIETPIRYSCGTAAPDVVIEPNQIIVAKLLRYQGEVQTECRLKMSIWRKTIYSNVFFDNVPRKGI